MPDLHHMPEAVNSGDLRNYEGEALPLLNARNRLASLSLNVSRPHSWDD